MCIYGMSHKHGRTVTNKSKIVAYDLHMHNLIELEAIV